MDFDGLNNSSPEEKNKKDKEKLYIKVLDIFGNSTLNSDNLGKYKNSEMFTTEVIKQLQHLGYLEDVKYFQEKIPIKPRNKQEEGEEFERLARITLMLVEKDLKNKI